MINKCLMFEVMELNKFASFYELLKVESPEKVFPGIKTVEEGDLLVELLSFKVTYADGKGEEDQQMVQPRNLLLQLQGPFKAEKRSATVNSLSMIYSYRKDGFIKCNIACSWVNEGANCGSYWILRTSTGAVLSHSRRSFVTVSSETEAELLAILWAVDSMKNMKMNGIIFESPFTLARSILLQPQAWPGGIGNCGKCNSQSPIPIICG